MASAVENTTSKQTFYDTKQQAVEYYNKNEVPKKMEDILNSMFYDNPVDVYGHLANYFEKFAKTPCITKVKSRPALDSKGQWTLQISIYCNIKNIDQCVCTVTSSNPAPCVLDNCKIEDKDAEEKEKKEHIDAAIELLDSELNEQLIDLNPCQQSDIDSMIYEILTEKKVKADALAATESVSPEQPVALPQAESPVNKKKLASGKKGKTASLIIAIPDELREKFYPGSRIVSCISQAVCCAGSIINKQPLYQYISTLYNKQESENKLCVPLPMVTILQTGKASPSKLKCIKEFMVIPKPGMAMSKAVEYIQEIYNHIAKSMYSKTGVAGKYVNDIGALCPLLEKPEQGLDMLQEAITSIGLKPGEDFHIALNIAAQEMFEFDKGKYEVMTGQLKSPDDCVEFWVDLISKYPSIIALIDPFRRPEASQWMRLCDKISTQCYIIGDFVYHRPALLKSEEFNDHFQSSGVVYKLEQMNTLTDLYTCQQEMKKLKNVSVLTTTQGDSTDSFIVDLAVGFQTKFIKIGAPCRGERIIKLNRLVQIEEELHELGKFCSHGDHDIPKINLPPPSESGEEEQPAASPSPRKDGKKK